MTNAACVAIASLKLVKVLVFIMSAKPDVNAMYPIHRLPLHDLQHNQESAYISAGLPEWSYSPPGTVESCTSWDASASAVHPPITGGTGDGDCVTYSASSEAR